MSGTQATQETPSAVATRQVAGEPELVVVIPAFNEEGGVAATIETARHALTAAGCTFDLVVVDDGSTDQTAARAEATGVRVIRLAENRGYGAALKVGILATSSPFVAIIDADGTYPGERLPEFLASCRAQDMVVGARAPDSSGIPLGRRWPKRFLGGLASYLAGQRIPDLNSGLRVIRRKPLLQFLPILPSGFSFTTTITLSLLCTGHRVEYVDIDYARRVGDSKIRPLDFFAFVILVIRTVLLFNPLKVFLPLGGMVFLAGLAKFAYDVVIGNLSESAVMALLTAIILWSVGALADMIARLQLFQRSS